jgi:hypothetical protein
MRRMSMLALALPALVFAVAAAGCGGSSKTAATTEATTEAVTTEATTTEAMTEVATTEAVTTEAATTTSPLSDFSAGKCRDLAESSRKLSAAFNATNGTDVKQEAALLQEFVKKVPSEIRPDFQVLADYVSRIADVTGNFKAGETPDAQTLAKLQKLATEVNQTKLTQASQHVSAWIQQNCHP